MPKFSGSDPVTVPTPDNAGYIDLASGIVNGIGNIVSTSMTNKANAKENEKARAYNLMLWNMENQYNTPAAQMARLMAAGLNPNLMYGGGHASTGNASSPSPASPVNYNAPEIDLPMTTALVSQIMDMRMKDEQIIQEKFKTGILQEEYGRSRMKNEMDMPIIKYIPKGRANFDEKYNEFYSQGPMFYLHQNEMKNSLMLQDIMKNNLGMEKTRKEIDSLQQMIRLRTQEADMNDELKKFNTTTHDPLLYRLLIKAINAIK